MKKALLSILIIIAATVAASAQKTGADTTGQSKKIFSVSRLTVGGYGEATYSHCFYSNSPYRYMYADRYKDAQGYGQVDLPHVVVMLGYDFGKGWTMGSEIEFEHGGVEASIEVEGDEAVEVEHEIERGGEVFLEQFWLQKEIFPALKIKAGMIIVPVGLTNTRHEPDKFFTVFRQEGENTILPCTWHQIGISVNGAAGDWKYEAQLLPGLNSRFFSNSNWINGGSASPYEYTMANSFAGAFRVDNFSIPNTRIGISGYVGGTNNDAYPRTISASGNVTTGVSGTVAIATADFEYKGKRVVARGNIDYGYLANAASIGTSNKNSDNSTFSPYEHTFVGKNAYAAGVEAGLDVFSFFEGRKVEKQKLYVFGRYEYYDSYVPNSGQSDYQWSDRHRVAVGLNWYPIKGIVVKAEWTERFLRSEYNNEPAINLGIAYTGFFNR